MFTTKRRSTTALLLAVALFGAGCLGATTDPAPTNDGGDESLDQSSTPSRGADEAAASPVEGATTESTGTTTSEPVPVDVPISWNGELADFVCVPIGPGSCLGVSTGDAWAHDRIKEEGTPLAATATLTWNPSSPLMQELVFQIGGVSSCGNGCTAMSALAEAQGPSPLALAIEDIELEEGEVLGLRVTAPNRLVSPLYARADTAQSFTVEGVATFLQTPGTDGAS